jgi:hypothetical protein
MHRKELNERSPLRVLEKSIHGGLGRGNLGIVAARQGVGKTAFLVGVALDDLMRGRNVLHVSLGEPTEKVCTFYDDVFVDLARTQKLEDVWRARRDFESHRRILVYSDGRLEPSKLRETIEFWRNDGDFRPAAIVLDGLDFDGVTIDDLDQLRGIAKETDAELWMSAVVRRDAERDEAGVPAPLSALKDAVDVILTMVHDGEGMHVGLLKDHDNPDVSELQLALDPTTMLLVAESSK